MAGKQRWEAMRAAPFMSPLGLKERVKKSCMEHVKKNRKRILDNLRSFSDLSSEVLDVSKSYDVNQMLVRGELSHDDYLEILTSLEDALREEVYLETLEQAEQVLADEEAWIEGFEELHLSHDEFILCPICKKSSLEESTGWMNGESTPVVSCRCGFNLPIAHDSAMSALSKFQMHVAEAFDIHRLHCPQDPSFHVARESFQECLFLGCNHCGEHMRVL
ncbi:hypothetical protein THRCLA_04055 [Thraustotheca clavata]|uniref:RPA-interacting protein C-terminal domain-containing protein n=1 Tax=Thraustotheca clavata TaxID=74557 RepID=A0A1W0A007_9STRA|nr:hypothetical protein THRCLA_04055 [Thraustotheca clavata]